MPWAAPAHRPAGRAAPAERKAQADADRPSAARRGYDRAWRRLRLQVLAEEPLCRECAARGRTTPAIEVDHVDGDAWNRARGNLRPLCKPCHSARTARDQAFARGGKVAPGAGVADPGAGSKPGSRAL